MKRALFYLTLCLALCFACTDEEEKEDPNKGDDNVTLVEDMEISVEAYRMATLSLPEGTDMSAVTWTVEADTVNYAVGTDGNDVLFIAGAAGDYALAVSAGSKKYNVAVTVTEPQAKVTPYLTKVYDFMPGLGQFVNELPKYEEGDTQEDMNAKCEAFIANTEKYGMVSLGGFGGYIVFGFDHTVINVEGKRDFRVLGNAFQAAANPDPDAPYGGSVEPGVIMVSYDRNHNGEPDDEWYEIYGSSHIDETRELWYDMGVENGNWMKTVFDYEITYHRPEQEGPEVGSGGAGAGNFVLIEEYAFWEDNQGNSGYKVKNLYHNQSYYPQWIEADSYTLRGTRLPDNGIDMSGQGSYYVLYGYRYGYVDNYPNVDKENSAVDIDWARDKDGNPVRLPGIDFVKVYNGVNQENGWIGENSTEVAGAVDCHVKGENLPTREQD